MTKTRDVNTILILASMALVAMGLVMVYSTSYVVAMKRYGNEYFFVKKHLIFITLGFLFFFIAVKIDYHFYQKWIYPLLLLSFILLLALTFIPAVGSTAGGARRWIKIGPLTFQPSEPAKLAVIVYLAYYLAAKKCKIKTFSKGFLLPMIISGFFILLILKEPDFGTAISWGAITIVMMFIGGVRLKHIFSLLIMAAPFIYLMVAKVDYRMKRVLVFLDPW
ncbi:MAG: FtsW/RodA/SpoVE family cell cycle protein, partial [Deltaproteobacteria bacterium]|nr:FtsW/RodA/SpoVE family cell cycle protein [Deltaproteobacteria bacterium]